MMNATNQTDKATARPLTFKASNKNTGAFYRKSTGDFSSNFESATELDAQQLAVVRATFDNVVAHSVIPSDRADISKTEHAALVAVAELAKSRVENHGCENYTDGKSYCDCNTCKTREALANLAAVREGGGK
jgi:hypothetical protein